MIRQHVAALLAVLATAACTVSSTPTDPTRVPPESGTYNVRVGGVDAVAGAATSYVGRQVSTNWDKDISWIYLGPDETNEPLLSLTMRLGNPTGTANISHVATAYLTTSKVRVGTGEELDGRSYTLTGGIIQFTVGANFIEGEIELTMERVLFHPEDTPETVQVLGTFRAVTK